MTRFLPELLAVAAVWVFTLSAQSQEGGGTLPSYVCDSSGNIVKSDFELCVLASGVPYPGKVDNKGCPKGTNPVQCPVITPNLTGVRMPLARGILEGMGFTVKPDPTPFQECLTVVSQDPKPGTVPSPNAKAGRVPAGTNAVISADFNKVCTPNVITTKSLAEAKTKIEDLGLISNQLEVFTKDGNDKVILQFPTKDVEVERGSTVTYVVQRTQPPPPEDCVKTPGPPNAAKFKISSVLGLTPEDALKFLADSKSGLKIETADQDKYQIPGTIYAQYPSPGFTTEKPAALSICLRPLAPTQSPICRPCAGDSCQATPPAPPPEVIDRTMTILGFLSIPYFIWSVRRLRGGGKKAGNKRDDDDGDEQTPARPGATSRKEARTRLRPQQVDFAVNVSKDPIAPPTSGDAFEAGEGGLVKLQSLAQLFSTDDISPAFFRERALTSLAPTMAPVKTAFANAAPSLTWPEIVEAIRCGMPSLWNVSIQELLRERNVRNALNTGSTQPAPFGCLVVHLVYSPSMDVLLDGCPLVSVPFTINAAIEFRNVVVDNSGGELIFPANSQGVAWGSVMCGPVLLLIKRLDSFALSIPISLKS